jgi:hypothetical protein
MAWHHIIPRSMLRVVWNGLVDQHIATETAEARLAIRQYLLLADRSLAKNIDALIDRIRAANTDQRRASHHPLHPLSVAESNQLKTAALWPAWNAVEGPKQRSDDPQNRYFDRFTAGLTPEEAARMRAIEVLFGHLHAFTKACPSPGPADLRSLAQAASLARRVLFCDLPIPFRPEMWVHEPGGQWRKRRDHERTTAA